MDAFAFVCLLAFVPIAAIITTQILLQSRDARLKLLERQVLDLHARVQQMEQTPRADIEAAAAARIEPSVDATDATGAPANASDPGPLAAVAPEPSSVGAPTAVAAPSAPEEASTVDQPPPTQAPPPVATPVATAPPSSWRPPSLERIAVWIGATLGAFALAVGGLFSVVAAVEAGWLGPGFRVGGAMALGTLAWVGGAAVGRRAPRAASGLSAAGAATVFGAIWAATDLYALVPTAVGFTSLVVVVAATMAQAARTQDRFLANLAVLGGLLASLVVDSTSLGLQLGYVLLLNVAVALLCSRRPWSELLLVVGTGTALQLLGLTATDRTPDHQLFALVGIAALLVPHALTAARSSSDGHRVASSITATMLLVLGAAWVPSLSDTFYDPRSGLARIGNPSDPRRAAIGLVAMLLPMWIAARGARSLPLTGLATLLALPATVAFVGGWTGDEALRMAVPLGITAGLVLAWARQQPSGEGLTPWFPAIALALILPGVDHTAGGMSIALISLTALALVASMTSTRAFSVVLVTPAIAIAAVALAASHESFGVGPSIGALLVLLSAPIVRRWRTARLPDAPWIAAVVAPTALFPALYIWWGEALGDAAIGLLPLLLAAWTLLLATVLVRRHRVSVHSATFTLGVLAVMAGITLALPLQLQERWLTVGWALEGAALAGLSRRLKHPLVRWTSVGLGVVVAVRLLVNPWALSYGDATGWPILNWTLYTWGIPTVCLLVSAHLLARDLPEGSPERAVPVVLRLLAMFTGFAMLNVQVSHAFQDQGPLSLYGTTMLQGMTRSIVWGAYGVGLLVVGLVANSRLTRFLGFGFILLSALKVFLLDAWSLPGFVRVGSLVGLGMFLLVSAFLFERLVLREPTSEGE